MLPRRRPSRLRARLADAFWTGGGGVCGCGCGELDCAPPTGSASSWNRTESCVMAALSICVPWQPRSTS